MVFIQQNFYKVTNDDTELMSELWPVKKYLCWERSGFFFSISTIDFKWQFQNIKDNIYTGNL